MVSYCSLATDCPDFKEENLYQKDSEVVYKELSYLVQSRSDLLNSGVLQATTGIYIRNDSRYELQYCSSGSYKGYFFTDAVDKSFKGPNKTIQPGYTAGFVSTKTNYSVYGASGYITFRIKTEEDIYVIVMGWMASRSGSNYAALEIRSSEGRNLEPTGVVSDISTILTIKHPGGKELHRTNQEVKDSFKLEYCFHNETVCENGFQLIVKNYLNTDSNIKADNLISNNRRIEIPGNPIQLIKQENGILSIEPKAFDIIKNLNGSIAICSVIGPYRSGKSFILNLLLNRQKAFELGPTSVSCTRGIWMWDTPILHSNKNGSFNLLFFDTEGLDSADVSQEHDNRMFVLNLLLSSLFLYNTKDVVNRKAIEQLAVMSNLAKFINSNTGVNNQMQTNMPDFIWVIRDFFLENAQSTPTNYLEQQLKLETNLKDDEHIKKVNFIRESIRRSFKSLECCLLPTPIGSGMNGKSFDETLRNLDNIGWNYLRKDFRELITNLSTSIKENISCKSIFSTPISAPAYANYLESIVKQLNENKKVEMADNLISCIKFASSESLKNALNLYDKNMKAFLVDSPLPQKWNLLENKHEDFFSISLEHLQKNLNGENEITKPFLDSFSKLICDYERNNNGEIKMSSGRWFEIRKLNIEAIKKFYKKKLEELWSENIQSKYSSNSLHQDTANINQEFKLSYKNMIETYKADSTYGNGSEKNDASSEWYEEKDISNLSDEIINKLEKERINNKLESEIKRLETEKKDAENRLKSDTANINENLKKINERYEKVQDELEKKQVKGYGFEELGQTLGKVLDNVPQILGDMSKVLGSKIIAPMFFGEVK